MQADRWEPFLKAGWIVRVRKDGEVKRISRVTMYNGPISQSGCLEARRAN